MQFCGRTFLAEKLIVHNRCVVVKEEAGRRKSIPVMFVLRTAQSEPTLVVACAPRPQVVHGGAPGQVGLGVRASECTHQPARSQQVHARHQQRQATGKALIV